MRKKTLLIASVAACVIVSSTMRRGDAKARFAKPEPRGENYSLTKGEPVPIAAHTTKLPMVVFGEEPNQPLRYVPSGFMGDTSDLKMTTADNSAPLPSGKKGRVCLKVAYNAKGRNGWSGVYFLTPANNWGKIKGAGFNLSGARKLEFWARGENGGERIAECKVGGIVGPYPDTDVASIGPLRLSTNWEKYAIDLTGKDLRHIVGGFEFLVKRADNPRGATFYLDEIDFVGDSSTVSPSSVESK